MSDLGVSQRPLTLILPQKYRDTNGRRIVIQIGGVYTTFCHREGIHLQKYAIEMGGVSRYFFTCIGVRGRFDSPGRCLSREEKFVSQVPPDKFMGENHR